MCIRDSCSNGVCVRSGSCDDHIACTSDFCDSGVRCLHQPSNSACADNNSCTFGETCSTFGCTFQVHFGQPCISGDLCYQSYCDINGNCRPSTNSPRCYDSDPCTQDVCDPATGACSFPPLPCGATLTINSVSPDVLSPANHKLILVTVSVSAHDGSGAPLQPILVSVTSNQPDDAAGPSDGHTTQDIQGADLFTADTQFYLRAERDRDLGERIYTIRYSVTYGGLDFYANAEVHVSGGGNRKTTLQSPKPRQKPTPKD